jgi:hypothetical protein
MRLAVLLLHSEWEELLVILHRCFGPRSANQPLGVKDSVLRVRRQLVLGSISDKALALFGEGDVRRCDPVTLVVGDNLNTGVLEDTNAVDVKMRARDAWMG